MIVGRPADIFVKHKYGRTPSLSPMMQRDAKFREDPERIEFSYQTIQIFQRRKGTGENAMSEQEARALRQKEWLLMVATAASVALFFVMGLLGSA